MNRKIVKKVSFIIAILLMLNPFRGIATFASSVSEHYEEVEVNESEKEEIRVAEIKTCSNAVDKNLVMDKNTDTFWTSKDKHELENRHYVECILEEGYELDKLEITLGRLSNNKWGFIPENLRVEAMINGTYEVVAELDTVLETNVFKMPNKTTISAIQISFNDEKAKGFSVREIKLFEQQEEDLEEGKTPYTTKKVYADYHGPRYTRALDGNTGNWGFVGEAKNSKVENKKVIKNPDIIGEDGRRDLAVAAYPMLGMQSQMDPDYHEYQILLAKMANIDGFFIEWGFPGHGTDKQLEIMMETAKKYDFELGINWCDAWHMKNWITNIKPEIDTDEEKIQEAVHSLSEVLEKLYASEVGALFEGHPVVYLFGGGFEKAAVEKITTEATLPSKFVENEPWYFRRASFSGKLNNEDQVDYTYSGSSWHGIVDGPFGWVPDRIRDAQQAGHKEFDIYGTKEDAIAYLEALKSTFINNKEITLRNSVVSPGMDNRPCAGWGDKFKYLDREDGNLYKAMWEYNAQNREYLDSVYIASWNDYTEGHQIEPTLEDGYRELETTQEYAYQFKGEGNLDDGGFLLPEKLFKLRKEVKRLNAIGLDVGDYSQELDQVGVLINEAAYDQAEALITRVEERLSVIQDTLVEETIICDSEQGNMLIQAQEKENEMPIVEIISPIKGEQLDFSKGIEIIFKAYDKDGFVEKTEVYLDGELIQPQSIEQLEDTNYYARLNALTSTLHSLSLKVYDNEGGYTQTESIDLYPRMNNVALNKPVRANGQFQEFGPELAVDGEISLASRWRTPSSFTEHWLEIDLQDTYEILRADLYMGDNTGFAIKNFKIEYWEDGAWKTIPETVFVENNKIDLVLKFAPVKTNRIRFFSNEEAGRGIRLKEIKLYAAEGEQ